MMKCVAAEGEFWAPRSCRYEQGISIVRFLRNQLFAVIESIANYVVNRKGRPMRRAGADNYRAKDANSI